jgi:hypothetical protein
VNRVLVVAMVAAMAWPLATGASSSLFFPPDAVIVQTGGTLLVARTAPREERWISLCREDDKGALDFDVQGLDRVGTLFDARLHWEFSGGFVMDDTRPPKPVDGSGLAELETRFQSVQSLELQTVKSGADGTDDDYWQVRILVDSIDGQLQPLARVEATPAGRDGAPLPGAESQRFTLGVSHRANGRCSLPDLHPR